jgi:hypothetical protein
MKKLTAILGLAAVLSLAGCSIRGPRAQAIRDIENKKFFSADDYNNFEMVGLRSSIPKIKAESRMYNIKDSMKSIYDFRALLFPEEDFIIDALFPLEEDGTTSNYAKEVMIFRTDNTDSIITFRDTNGDDILDTKETHSYYTPTIIYKPKSWMDVTESLK